jgi:hypothetical protein
VFIIERRGENSFLVKRRFNLVNLIGVLALIFSSLPWIQSANAQASDQPEEQSSFFVYFPLVLRDFDGFDGPSLPFGYGWNVANFAKFQPASGQTQYPATSFNWLKITKEPGSPTWLCKSFRLRYNVLLRLNAATASTSAAAVGSDASYWAAELHKHTGNTKCVEAFEIGNEPNLSGMYGGTISPNKYADQLCAAYDAIKAVDSSYIVVSAGLAPTGGINANSAWDEEDFTRKMLNRIRSARGSPGACFDAFGYHNYGFRTGYAADPNDPAKCPTGMCFRGAERIWNILSKEYGVRKRIWSTEFGWMRDFVEGGCGDAPWASTFAGFPVSDEAQASNLVGSFQYTRSNWPWMGAMFVFNLDFNVAPWYSHCESDVTWFGVKGYPAEEALEEMPKS